MEAVLAAVVAGLLVDRYLLIRSHHRDQQIAGELDSKVIDFAEHTARMMATQVEESRAQVSEMATRIQHPELMRPDIRAEENQSTEPTYDDEFGLVGRVLSDD